MDKENVCRCTNTHKMKYYYRGKNLIETTDKWLPEVGLGMRNGWEKSKIK